MPVVMPPGRDFQRKLSAEMFGVEFSQERNVRVNVRVNFFFTGKCPRGILSVSSRSRTLTDRFTSLFSTITAHSISILSELKTPSFSPYTQTRRCALHQLRYQLHSVEGPAKCPAVPQRRELVTVTRAAGQDSK